MRRRMARFLVASTMVTFLTGCPSLSDGQVPLLCEFDLEIAIVSFSDGLTGRITYDSLTNTSRSFFSDGSYTWTTHTAFNAFTTYSDGRTSNSTYNAVTKTVTTRFSDNTTATTTFNDFTNTVVTHYSEGRTAIITYTDFPVYVESPVCGIHLMPDRSNIIVDPNHPAVQEIRRLRNMDDAERKASGWLKSEG